MAFGLVVIFSQFSIAINNQRFDESIIVTRSSSVFDKMDQTMKRKKINKGNPVEMVESSSAATGGIKGTMAGIAWARRRKRAEKEKEKEKKSKRIRGEVCWKMREIVLAAEPQTFRFLHPVSPFFSSFFSLSENVTTSSSVDVPWKIPASPLLRANRTDLTAGRVGRVGENFLATSPSRRWNRDGRCPVAN